MSTVAEQLRLGREAKSLTVHQVAEVTKFRTDHVRAVEEGNFDVFSAPVYIRGFVRSYATLLKLDVPRIMSRLEEELGQSEKFREPPPLSDQPRTAVDFVTLQFSKLNWRIASIVMVVLAGVLLLVLIARVRRHYLESDPSANLPPGIYQPGQSGDTLPVPAPARRGQ